jgi:hypothetical protein
LSTDEEQPVGEVAEAGKAGNKNETEPDSKRARRVSYRFLLTMGFLACLAFAMLFYGAHVLTGEKLSPKGVPEPPPVTPPPAPAPEPNPGPAPAETPTMPPGTSQMVKEWTGTSKKTTEPFTMNGAPWAIAWENEPEPTERPSVVLFQIVVYSAENPGSPITLAARTAEKDAGTTWINEPGTFYLAIHAANTQWTVQVLSGQ